MIGKLSKDQKVDWPMHLPELVHAYNSVRLAITGYSPYYLMFRCQPHLHIDFYFPTIWDTEKHWHVNYYVAKVCEQLQKAFTAEAKRQKGSYDRKANAILLGTGDLVLGKANAYKGKRKVKDQWE